MFAFSQNRVVSGKVTDKDGAAVPFASVKVKGSRTGISADAYGAYSIRIKDGDVLEISATGFKAVDVPVGTQTYLTSVLEKGTNTMTEVVVTSAGVMLLKKLHVPSEKMLVGPSEKMCAAIKLLPMKQFYGFSIVFF